MSLKDTLNLPDKDFTIPMRAGLPNLEKKLQERWASEGIYHVIQKEREGAETYVLHDGPPYTNGPIHVGTALNKILKDFVTKSQTLMGKRAPYVPGYDNHGLPIELAVQKKLANKKKKVDVVGLRKACREHAQHYIGVQTGQFQRLGVFGLWENAYDSLAYRYEAELVRCFKRLVEAGFVYRGLRPVLWSPTARTALADTEIIYKDHVSKAIHVAFPVKSDPDGGLGEHTDAAVVIWTTTPWTIPANLGIAFHSDLDYVVVTRNGQKVILAKGLLDATKGKIGGEGWEVLHELKGKELENVVFTHPIYGRDSRGLLAGYVTLDEGTGCVHTAPGHGRDDFITGQKYGLEVLCPVDERGMLTAEAGEFEGVRYTECDTVVVDRLRELGALLHVEDYHHSYPHAERDEKPVIFRATEQWFISMEHDGLRGRMLEEIKTIGWHPAPSEKRITAMIEGRPDWCISRQRPWGVGIPIFYGKESGEPVMDPAAIEAVAKMTEERGSDAWYDTDPADILPEGYKHPETGETEFRKERDVFDVWFDSGCTSLCVLEGNVEPEWKEDLPSDLYLEGSDQHRGWFNVSMIIGMALKGDAPYEEVATHGFVTDDQGRKMSKRLGNATDPVEVCEKHGADILRYWAASVDYTGDVPIGEELLKEAGDKYRRVRNTLRFLLSNLYDYTDAGPMPDKADLLPLDRWVVEMSDWLAAKVLKDYASYNFRQAEHEISYFCTEYMSAFYLDVIKDRMYCDQADSASRRSAQHACFHALRTLVALVAPILPHTAEEVYDRLKAMLDEPRPTIHAEALEAKGNPETMRDGPLFEQVWKLLEVRQKVFARLEEWRAEHGVKDSQDVECDLTLPSSDFALLKDWSADLAIILKMARVSLTESSELSTAFSKTGYETCDRSRLRRSDVEQREWEGEMVKLTKRDREALGIG